jgi:hypothetical protein
MNLEATEPRAPERRPGSWGTCAGRCQNRWPVFMATVSAPQHVNVLVMVRAGKVGSTDNDLPVSVPVAWLGRPLTHSAQYTYHRVRGTRSPSPSKPPQTDALSSVVLLP